MGDDPFGDFINLLNKDTKAHASEATTGLDLALSSHIPFGIPSGIPQLDLSLKRPGLPAGRIVEYYGFEACGKTTAALQTMGCCQKIGGLVHFIDTEKHWDPVRAAQCGVDPARVIISECDSLEAVYRTLETAAEKLAEMKWKRPFLVVVDSATAVLSENEFEKEIGEEYRVGQDARTSRLGLRKLNSDFADRNMTVVFVNHLIAKIGQSYGKQSVSAGGHAIKFYSSIRVEFSKTQNLFDKDKDGAKHFLGQITKMELTKNKVSHTGIMDFKVPLVDIGFDTYEGLFEAYKTMGLMEKVNQKTWLFKPADVQVSKKDWRIFVESQGGLWEAYKNFLKIAQEREDIKPYGGTNG